MWPSILKQYGIIIVKKLLRIPGLLSTPEDAGRERGGAGGADELDWLVTGQTEWVQYDHSSLTVTTSPAAAWSSRGPGYWDCHYLKKRLGTCPGGVTRRSREKSCLGSPEIPAILTDIFLYCISIATHAIAKKSRRNIPKGLGTSPRSP